MKYSTPLIDGVLVRRYKRFLADVTLASEETITVYCPNTGRMIGCDQPGFRVRLSRSDNSTRKYEHTLEQVHDGRTWIAVHPLLSNRVVREAIQARQISSLSGYAHIQPEASLGPDAGRADFLLTGHGTRPDCFVEVKSTTLADPPIARFPDAVTARGARQLAGLTARAREGLRAVVLFCVQREDCTHFELAEEIDPTYTKALRLAARGGVEVYAYRLRVGETELSLGGQVQVDLRRQTGASGV